MRRHARPRRLVLSQGDPRGVGPELLLRLAADEHLMGGDRVIADPERLAELARALAVPWATAGWRTLETYLEPVSGAGAIEALEQAVDRVISEPSLGLVTAPIDKAACHAAGFAYPGHTEYLAARTGVDDVAMFLVGPRLRVVLATIHLPLRRVAETLTERDIIRAGSLLTEALIAQFGVEHPRVGVLGLNPHAGERGLLGDEETRIVGPAVDRLREAFGDRASFRGPLPADTAFPLHARGELDALVAMYHDQGLGPFKLMHFSDGVNMTLGLPFVRTSPDHGTAKDIAGTGVADPSSMVAAVRLARGSAG